MFWITEDTSSGSLAQCLAKNYKNGSIYRWNQWLKITRMVLSVDRTILLSVSVDRTILVIFRQALYKAP